MRGEWMTVVWVVALLATNVLDEGFDASPSNAGDALDLRGVRHLGCLGAR